MEVRPNTQMWRTWWKQIVVGAIGLLLVVSAGWYADIVPIPIPGPVPEPVAIPTPSPIMVYEPLEISLTSGKSYTNPFLDVTLSVTFTAPSGKSNTAYGFYDGGSVWRVRFAPEEVGTWTYKITCNDTANAGLHNRAGSFDATPPTTRGFIRPDPAHPNYFAFSDGTPFFGMGDTAWAMVDNISNAQRVSLFNTRASQGFNFIQFYATGAKKHPTLSFAESWPFGGTPSAPDYDRFNPQYFARLEGIIGELRDRNMYAKISLFNHYTVPFSNASLWTTARNTRWVRYLISRLAAYRNVFLWGLTGEYEQYPDGAYRYDNPSDDIWVRNMGSLIHSFDPQNHPVTNDLTSVSTTLLQLRSGEVGKRFGTSPGIDVLGFQYRPEENRTWTGQYWDSAFVGVETAHTAHRSHLKPVGDFEPGFEWLQNYSNFSQQVFGTDTVRRGAWRIFTGGGAFYAAGFIGSALGADGWFDAGGVGPWAFVVADMGLARQLTAYYTFITTKTAFQKMSPAQSLVNAPNLCLANPGQEYVVYAPSGGTVTLDLSSVSGSFAVEWLNPRTGAYQGQTVVSGGSRTTLVSPDTNDWVVHLTSQGGSAVMTNVALKASASASSENIAAGQLAGKAIDGIVEG